MPFVKIGGVDKEWIRLGKSMNRITLSKALLRNEIWNGRDRAYLWVDWENGIIAIEPTTDLRGNKITNGRITCVETPMIADEKVRFPATYDPEKCWIVAKFV